jgi:hypothetical protein
MQDYDRRLELYRQERTSRKLREALELASASIEERLAFRNAVLRSRVAEEVWLERTLGGTAD